ncbi:MAG: tetratricopeptide repeat protein, partial [Bacteroidales bacterium]|nr:tetratricopeptide repeat protein [Bacteroidales bacterium]
MKFRILNISLILSLLLVAACGTQKRNTKTRTKPLVFLLDENKYKTSAQLIDAVKEKNMGNFQEAESLLRNFVSENENSSVAHYQLALVYQELDKIVEALNSAKIANKLEPNNQWYLQLLGELYDQMHNYKESNKIWQNLAKDYPDQHEYCYNTVLANVYQGKWEEAIKGYDLLEKQIGPSEELALAKQRIWLMDNNVDKGAMEIEKLAELYPREVRFPLMIGDLYMTNEMHHKAKIYYDRAYKIDSLDPYVNVALANFYKKTDNKTDSYGNLKIAFANPKMDIDTKVKVLLSYYTVTELYDTLLSDAYALANILVETHPYEAKAWSIYGDFLIRDARYMEAEEAFAKVLLYDKSKFIIWEQYLMLLSNHNKDKELLEASSEAIELFPSQPFLFLSKGLALYNLQRYSEAIESLEFGRRLLIEDNETAESIYVYLAESYYKEKQYAKSYQNFDKALKINPRSKYVLNNYSYYLSLQEEKLDLAISMCEKLMRIEPNNANSQDTYAWVLFKANKIDEALIWIE